MFPSTTNTEARTQEGQAIVELIIGMVAILSLLAGLLQVVTLTMARTETMVEARKKAGQMAILDLSGNAGILSNPDYIRDWQEGPDQMRHSTDDYSTPGNAILFDSIIVDKAAANSGDWNYIDATTPNRLSGLHGSFLPASHFGLIAGSDDQSVDLLPAVKHLLYDADSIVIESEVWMTYTKGIY